MLDGVSIIRSEKVKDELVLDGNDIELVSRSAALINQVFVVYFFHSNIDRLITILFFFSSVDFYSFSLSRFLYCFYRNVMWRKKISVSSWMVSMWATREILLSPKSDSFWLSFCTRILNIRYEKKEDFVFVKNYH